MTLITGTDGVDVLWGTVEDDIVNGGAGDDILQGGAGDDRIDGGAGNDTLSFDLFVSSLTVDLEAGTATGEGNDTLVDIEARSHASAERCRVSVKLPSGDSTNSLYSLGVL